MKPPPSQRNPSPLKSLASRHGLKTYFPGEVLEEVDTLIASPGLHDPQLDDLEDLPFVTIDNPDSRDLDQALFIQRAPNGFSVSYALADAAFYVRSGTALFEEAVHRGSSYYLPGMAIPMLPRALSEGLISLNPDEIRRSLVFVMTLDEDGRCRTTDIVRARIRSRRKLSYARVQRSWDDPAGAGFRGEPFDESLGLLGTVGRLRMLDAHSRHVVDYHRLETRIRFTRQGVPHITTRVRFEVERCNEQISLMCNIEGAKILKMGLGIEYLQPIFRVHPAPTEEHLDRFKRQMAALAQLHGLDPRRWAWKGPDQPLAQYLEALPRRARPRLAAAIERQAILTNRRSIFTSDPGAHHGIGAPVYARFSSPMREIVGIFTHKEALELINGPASADPTEADLILRNRVVEAGNRSKSLQRRLEKETEQLVLDQLFEDEIQLAPEDRPSRRGTVMGMKGHLIYIRLDDPPIEVKIHLSDLNRHSGSQWRLDPHRIEVQPPNGTGLRLMRMGGAVDLRLDGHDEKRRRWLLVPVQPGLLTSFRREVPKT